MSRSCLVKSLVSSDVASWSGGTKVGQSDEVKMGRGCMGENVWK